MASCRCGKPEGHQHYANERRPLFSLVILSERSLRNEGSCHLVRFFAALQNDTFIYGKLPIVENLEGHQH